MAGALGLIAPPLLAAPRGPARPAQRAAYPLAPGRSFWVPELSPSGPVVAFVNLYTQHTQVYRNGIAVGYSSVSTGKPGHGTPSGLFTVLEKRRHHRSNLYSNAPMPWMIRLTWGGIAFHGGALPGYPASHGCIRLPMDFAARLFSVLGHGDTVAVLRHAPGAGLSPLPALAPIDPQGQPLLQPGMIAAPTYWREERAATASVALAQRASTAAVAPASTAAATAPQAAASAPAPIAPASAMPLSLLASLPQRRLFVMRGGRMLASAALPEGVSAWSGATPVLVWSAKGQWEGAHGTQPSGLSDAQVWQQLLGGQAAWAERLRAHLVPGSTLAISPLPALSDVHTAAWGLTA